MALGMYTDKNCRFIIISVLSHQLIALYTLSSEIVSFLIIVLLGAPAGAIAGSVFGGIAIGIILMLLAGGILLAVLWIWRKKKYSYEPATARYYTHDEQCRDFKLGRGGRI